MLQKHVPTTSGSSPAHPAGIHIRPIPGTLRSAGSTSSSPSPSPSPISPSSTSSQPLRSRKTRSLRETITKKVGTFLEAHVDRQKQDEGKHLSEPVLRPLLTTGISLPLRDGERWVSPLESDELQTSSTEEENASPVDNLSRLIRNAVTCPIHKASLLSLHGEAAADTLLLMQHMLDDPITHEVEACRHGIRRLLIRLSKEARILPASLFLTGVVCRVRESFNGGAFADIYRASLGDRPVALKRLRVFRVVVDKESRELNAAFFREALVWRQLRHPHILPFWGIDRTSFRPYLCMVSPYMENGNILQCIQHLERIKADVPHEPWLLEIARGLEYLHQEQVVHGDLRGVNILIDEDLHVRLSDFGLSTLVDSNPLSGIPSNNGGMGRWSAPELFQGSQSSFKSDIWSFACVCIEMYTRLPPFAHLSEMQVMVHIMDGDLPKKPSPHTGIQQYMLNLLDRCLETNPGFRPDASVLARILSRCGIPKHKPTRQKPLPARPVETDTDSDPPTSRSRSASPSDAPRTSQYLVLPSTSPRSVHSFVMVPSTPSANSQESHVNVELPSSPSAGSSESHAIAFSSPSTDGFGSRVISIPSSSSSSSPPHHLCSSDASSGYDLLPESPEH